MVRVTFTLDDLPCKLIGFLTSELTFVKYVSLMIEVLAAVRQVGGSSSLRAIMLESAASMRMFSNLVFWTTAVS